MDSKLLLSLPKAHRRTVIALLVVICIVFFLVDAFLIPLAPAAVQANLSGLVQAIMAALLVSVFLYWIIVSFLPRTQQYSGMQQIEPTNITPELDSLMANALRWRYTGNFGRHLRAKVLPTLAGRPNMQIAVSVIDPQDRDLCQRHAVYRNSIHSIEKGRHYNSDTVALEVIVTIIHCAWYVANKGMSIEMHLLSMYDPLRIDSNDDAMILTVEDRTRPALKLERNHFMYHHFDLQMRYEREQGRQLDLNGFPNSSTISAIDENQVETFLCKIGMKKLCEDLTASNIVDACRTSRNPYDD